MRTKLLARLVCTVFTLVPLSLYLIGGANAQVYPNSGAPVPSGYDLQIVGVVVVVVIVLVIFTLLALAFRRRKKGPIESTTMSPPSSPQPGPAPPAPP